MKRLFTISVFCLISFIIEASNEYDIKNIPNELIKDAHSVIRNEELVFEISSIDNAILKVKFAVTVLNENGYRFATFKVPYDKFSKIKSIRADVYDAQGNHVKKIKQDDIFDVSIIRGYQFYDDNRMKLFESDRKIYPFTLEYSYEISFKGLLSYPYWSVYQDFNVSVQNSSFKVITPEDHKIRYLERNGISPVAVNTVDSEKIYAWHTSNKSALKSGPYSPNIIEFSPSVFLAPRHFEIGGQEGRLDSWNDFGKWISKLNEGRNELSPESKNKIIELVSNENSGIDKVKKLYNHLQSNTRYVSIQLGIGGWQPFEADFVDRMGYGDCKALTNYMKTMLDIVDIPSNYVLVKAGANVPNIFSDFPSNQFNHAFLMVPMNQDTIWLECTSQHIPFNYLGTFTDDRDVLVITDKGTQLVHTPSYGLNENKQSRNITAEISAEGHLTISTNTNYHGLFYDNKLRNVLADQATRKKLLYNSIDLASFNIVDLDYAQEKSAIPIIKEKLSLEASQYGKSIGDKLIFAPNILTKLKEIPQKNINREVDIVIKRSFKEEDSVTFKVPQNFSLNYTPKPLNIESKFGKYECQIVFEDGLLIYRRQLEIYKGRHNPSEYREFADFLSNVSKGDKEKVLFVKGS